MKGKLVTAGVNTIQGRNGEVYTATVVLEVDGETKTIKDAFMPKSFTAKVLREAKAGDELELELGTTTKGTPMIRRATNGNSPTPFRAKNYGGYNNGFNNSSAAAGGMVHDVVTLVAARTTSKTTAAELASMVAETEAVVVACRQRLIEAVDGKKSTPTTTTKTTTVDYSEEVDFGE